MVTVATPRNPSSRVDVVIERAERAATAKKQLQKRDALTRPWETAFAEGAPKKKRGASAKRAGAAAAMSPVLAKPAAPPDGPVAASTTVPDLPAPPAGGDTPAGGS